MEPLTTPDELDRALARPRALLYKHSPICLLSSRSRRQIDAFTELFPDAPVYVVDVLRARFISGEIETRLGIRHESPQAILVEAGKPARSASHRRITTDRLVTWWSGEKMRD